MVILGKLEVWDGDRKFSLVISFLVVFGGRVGYDGICNLCLIRYYWEVRVNIFKRDFL